MTRDELIAALTVERFAPVTPPPPRREPPPDLPDDRARMAAWDWDDPDADDDPGPLDGPCGSYCLCPESDPCVPPADEEGQPS